MNHLSELLYFIKERHSIYLKREKGLPKPWSADPIFQTYKFCNVYRELDTVTRWIKNNIREPFSKSPDLWFMLCIARQINWPDTLQELITKGAWPDKNWDWKQSCEVMRDRKKRGEKVYTGAYMLRGDNPIDDEPNDKPLYTCGTVLGFVWNIRKEIEPKLWGSLEDAHTAFLDNPGWGSFLAAQVVADLKYTRYLRDAEDWWTWAASGPGSRRGMNRVLGWGPNPKSHLTEKEWLSELQDLSKEVAPRVKKWGYPPLCNQDLQSTLCELDKYLRVKRGEGRPRSLYKGI